MTRVGDTNIRPESVDPAMISAALSKHGWRLVGGRDGLYSRWAFGEDRQARLLIPLNPTKPDFRELLHDAVDALKSSPLDAARAVLRALSAQPGDEVRFRKETRAVPGTINWSIGEELFAAARETLTASAKATSERRAYFGNSNSRIAKDFLSAVLMGQTEVGSYVVTAYTPPTAQFYERTSQKREGFLSSLGAHSGREVVEVMVTALEITRSAIDYYNRTNSLEEFDAGIEHGVSHELTRAVQKLVNESDGAEISVEWNTEAELDLFRATSPTSREVEFKPTDYSVLERASSRLRTPADVEDVTLIGTVEVLTRQTGSIGVVTVSVIEGSRAKRVRVRLPADSYEIAVEAHRRRDAILVSGRQEREGNLYWIYSPGEVTILPSSEGPTTRTW